VYDCDDDDDTDKLCCVGLLRWLLSTWNFCPSTSTLALRATATILQIISTIRHAASRRLPSVSSLSVYVVCVVIICLLLINLQVTSNVYRFIHSFFLFAQ